MLSCIFFLLHFHAFLSLLGLDLCEGNPRFARVFCLISTLVSLLTTALITVCLFLIIIVYFLCVK